MVDKTTSSERYLKALGDFIDTFSHLEGAVFFLLVNHAGVTMSVGRAIFSGTRIDAAISFIRRIHAANTGIEKMPDEEEDLLMRLQTLNTARNELVHFGGTLNEANERVVSNWIKAHIDKALKEQPISAEMVEAMTHDADKLIRTIFEGIVAKAGVSPPAGWVSAPNSAWQYKYPQDQKPKANKSQPSGPAETQGH
jgi:hypothetical protein